jgi:hypothetical protein
MKHTESSSVSEQRKRAQDLKNNYIDKYEKTIAEIHEIQKNIRKSEPTQQLRKQRLLEKNKKLRHSFHQQAKEHVKEEETKLFTLFEEKLKTIDLNKIEEYAAICKQLEGHFYKSSHLEKVSSYAHYKEKVKEAVYLLHPSLNVQLGTRYLGKENEIRQDYLKHKLSPSFDEDEDELQSQKKRHALKESTTRRKKLKKSETIVQKHKKEALLKLAHYMAHNDQLVIDLQNKLTIIKKKLINKEKIKKYQPLEHKYETMLDEIKKSYEKVIKSEKNLTKSLEFSLYQEAAQDHFIANHLIRSVNTLMKDISALKDRSSSVSSSSNESLKLEPSDDESSEK